MESLRKFLRKQGIDRLVKEIIMPALTTAQMFGPSATLTGTTLTITLSDFSGVGLSGSTPSATDVMAAIILRQLSQMPTDASTDTTVGYRVEAGFVPFAFARNNTQFEHPYNIYFYTPASGSSLDPDNVI